MSFIRRSVIFAQSALAAFFTSNRGLLLDARELDDYLFDREARMDKKVWWTDYDNVDGEAVRSSASAASGSKAK